MAESTAACRTFYLTDDQIDEIIAYLLERK